VRAGINQIECGKNNPINVYRVIPQNEKVMEEITLE
jgi:hypothetical protein